MKKLTMAFAILVLMLSAASFSEEKTASDTASLIRQLKSVIDGQVRDPNAEGQLVDQLAAGGEKSVPIVAASLEAEQNLTLQAWLAKALAQIPGDKGVSALLSLYVKRPDLRNPIEAGLMTGRVRKGLRVERALTPEEYEAFAESIKNEYPLRLRNVVQVLCLFDNVDLASVAEAILARVLYRIGNPIESVPAKTSLPSSYLPPQIAELSYLFDCLGYLGAAAIPVLKVEKAKTNDAQISQWLDLALGYAGAEELAPVLEDLVKNEPDRYKKYIAIQAYAGAAKDKAIPLLETFRNDTTVSEYGSSDGPQMPLLQQAALQSLNSIKARNTSQQ